MVSTLKKIYLFIRAVTFIGIITYFLLIPSRIQARKVSQTELTEKSQFDMTLLYIVIGLVGGLIILTLLYVGYRKYRGEQKKEEQKKFHDEQKG